MLSKTQNSSKLKQLMVVNIPTMWSGIRNRRNKFGNIGGKIEEKIDPDELKKDLYSSIFKSISVQKKDRKKIITSIDKVIEKYDDYW